MYFYYLLLGHLLGDFTFQTDTIAKNKSISWKWILLHSIIITICMLFLVILLDYKLIGLVLINGVIHFFIDYYKSKLPVKNSLWEFIYFVIDQAAHIIIIYLISLVVIKNPNILPLPIDRDTLNLLIALVFITSFSSIFIQYILRIIFYNNFRPFFIKNERLIGKATRISLFIIFYFSYFISIFVLILIPVIIVLAIIYYHYRSNKWMSLPYFRTKLILDLVMSLIGFSLILLAKL